MFGESNEARPMETRIDEIADGIYRLSTFVAEVNPPVGFTSHTDHFAAQLAAAAS